MNQEIRDFSKREGVPDVPLHISDDVKDNAERIHQTLRGSKAFDTLLYIDDPQYLQGDLTTRITLDSNRGQANVKLGETLIQKVLWT